jgi:hypothetical protein
MEVSECPAFYPKCAHGEGFSPKPWLGCAPSGCARGTKFARPRNRPKSAHIGGDLRIRVKGCGRVAEDLSSEPNDSSAGVGLVVRLGAEVAWHVHLEASVRADVSSKPSNNGGSKDENSRHEDANEHLKKDAKARLKRLRNTHGSGGLVKQVEDLLRQLLPRAIGNTNSRKSRPRQFYKGLGENRGLCVLAFASWMVALRSRSSARIAATPARGN